MTRNPDPILPAHERSRRAGRYLRGAVLALHQNGPQTALEMTVGTDLGLGTLRQQLTRESGRKAPFLCGSWEGGGNGRGEGRFVWRLTKEGKAFAKQVEKEERDGLER